MYLSSRLGGVGRGVGGKNCEARLRQVGVRTGNKEREVTETRMRNESSRRAVWSVLWSEAVSGTGREGEERWAVMQGKGREGEGEEML